MWNSQMQIGYLKLDNQFSELPILDNCQLLNIRQVKCFIMIMLKYRPVSSKFLMQP